MKFFRRKLIPLLLAAVLASFAMPFAVSADAEAVTVSSYEDIMNAIAAIPEGGSGEITIQDIYIFLDEYIYIEGKDVTFNLVGAGFTASENLIGPVIYGVDADITINLDEQSSVGTQGHTDAMGLVRIENSGEQNDTFTLAVNGGRYTCSENIPEGGEADYSFAAAPGTKVVLTDVVCEGAVTETGSEGAESTVTGELVINSGKFVNDVSAYAADGKYSCAYGDNYYVRDKEMTDDFSKLLTDGKIVFKCVKPADEEVWMVFEDLSMNHPEVEFDGFNFNDDLSKLELGIYLRTGKEEFHTVDVVWDYDADVLQKAQPYIEKFTAYKSEWFKVSDLELVNYWTYCNSESLTDSLANYSNELKSILDNTNFLYTIENRAGEDDVFYTARLGTAKLSYEDKVYYTTGMIGALAEHTVCVPENTADTKEALIAAAQKRIDDYIGTNKIKITAADETVTEYYNSELANYDNRLAAAKKELEEAQKTLDAELAKDAELQNPNIISQCQITIMECNSTIEYAPQWKEYFISRFDKDGDLHFLKNAAGDFIFNVEIVGKEKTYKCVIIKDDKKLTVPSYATVDLNTNVSVTTDSSTVPLDTIVKVEKLTEGNADYDEIIKLLDVEDNETFDIKLHSGSLNKNVTELKDGKFEVKIPVPEKFKGKDLVVYYVDENKKIIEYEAQVKEDNFAVFATDHFSIYTLAEKATGSVSAPPTGDNSSLWLWAALAFAGSGILFEIIFWKRKKRAEEN